MSKKYTLNSIDLRKVLIGAGVAMAGALLTYVTELIPSVDFGVYTPVVAAFWSVIANALRKFLTGK